MLDHLPTIQTSLERILSKRIEKAHSILAIIKTSSIYSTSGELDSVNGLEKDLTSYGQASSQYFDILCRYLQMASDRKNLLKDGKHSIKKTAYAVMRSFTQNLDIDKVDRRKISSHYSLIYAQNRLAAPYDFAKPSYGTKMSEYLRANSVLLLNFKEMVEMVGKYVPPIPIAPYSTAHCHLLILEAERLDKEINQLIEKSYSLYVIRIGLFDLIKQRCASICNQSRFIFGANSSQYKQIKRFKLSIV